MTNAGLNEAKDDSELTKNQTPETKWSFMDRLSIFAFHNTFLKSTFYISVTENL